MDIRTKTFQLGVVVVGALACFVGCVCEDSEPLRLVDDYYLIRWQVGKNYYLTQSPCGPDGGGLIEGVVIEIGWSEEYIVAKRKSTARIDKDGWMLIDVRSGEIQGPFSDDQFNELTRRYEIAGMNVRSPQEVWKASVR